MISVDSRLPERPKASVVMVTYNHKSFIAQAIESVLMQETTFPFELVIGEDRSTDGTRQIVQEYSAKYPNLIRVLFSESNLGAHLNFKSVLDSCRGEFLACLEGDDYWTDSKKLQKQIHFLESHPSYSSSCHRTQLMNGNGSPGIVYGTFDRSDLGVTDTILVGSPWHNSSFVFRRAHFEAPQWLWKMVSVDMAMFSILAGKGPVRSFPEVMSVYRKHPGGITETDFVKSTFHEKRIELMQYLDVHFQGRFHDQIQTVKEYHLKNLPMNSKVAGQSNPERSQVRNLFARSRRLAGRIKRRLFPSTPRHPHADFIEPRCETAFLDTFIVRSRILGALKQIQPLLNGTILDIGCGRMPYRQLVLAAPSRATKYLGLDFAHSNYAVQPDLVWEGERIPLPDGAVDCALATEVFEHCPEPERVMREAARVLKPGGMLFFTVPFLWPLHESPHDEYRYTPFALERHLHNSGFQNIEMTALGGWDASLGQMIGLWVRRRPMNAHARQILSFLALPLIRHLNCRDRLPNVRTDQIMITGITGTAIKPGLS